MSSPSIPKTPDVQLAKEPDLADLTKARKQSGGMAGGTLLTGPSGIDNASLNTGGTTLLGG